MKNIVKLMSNVDRVMQSVNEQMAKNEKPEVTFRDFKTLVLVHSDGVKGPAKLADLSGISSAAMTGSIDSLEKKGLIIREHATHDRRVTPIKLTGLGISVLDAAEDSL